MKTITFNLYQFSELTPEAQQAAITKLSDINTRDQWWECEYYDAQNVGLKIVGFDLDRKVINGHFIEDAETTANKITESHGHECDTYGLADIYLIEYSNGSVLNTDELEVTFLKDLLGCYLDSLQNFFNHLNSESSIKETIITNEFDFLEDGTPYIANK